MTTAVSNQEETSPGPTLCVFGFVKNVSPGKDFITRVIEVTLIKNVSSWVK